MPQPPNNRRRRGQPPKPTYPPRGHYNQPTYPHQPVRPPMAPPPFPPNNLLEHRLRRYLRQFWSWYRTKSRRVQIIVACGIILALCVFYGSAAAIVSTNLQTPTAQATPTNTPTQDTSLLALTPADTPTDVPTDTPIPTDTPTPEPTATPTPHLAVQPTPTARPQPTPTPHHTGVNGNPWGYDFNPGNYITYPPSGFCSYFNCIATFYASDDPGDGYVVECSDSTYSQSGGESGACSSHGGVMRPLYAH
jgi:hypothetical protein